MSRIQPGPGPTTEERFSRNRYVVRQKVFKLFGSGFHIYDEEENVILYCNMKAFKLKEDIRLYTGEDMQTELLTIKARQVIDFSASYDVVDTATKQKVGALRRKGLKSILKDEWVIMDVRDNEIGLITEDSTLKALVRRFVDLASTLMPQGYDVTINGKPVAVFKQNFNPFVRKLKLDFSLDEAGLLDPRLGLAAAVLLCAIEGRQT
jgi:hypothetical protein